MNAFVTIGAIVALGAATDAKAIRTSLERVAEMKDFWRFMKRTRHSSRPGSIEAV
jgi:hypothetical protein